MKIHKLYVKNFRSFGSGEKDEGACIDLTNSNLVFLIGKNNCGKSSLLEAYDLFQKADREVSEWDFHQKDITREIQIEAWIATENEKDRAHASVSAWLDEKGIARIRKTWSKPNSPAAKESFDPKSKKWTAGGAGGFDTLLQNGCPNAVWIRGMATPEDVTSALQKLVAATILKRLAGNPSYKKALDAIKELQGVVNKDEYTGQIEGNLNAVIAKIFPGITCNISSTGEQDFEKILASQTEVRVTETERPPGLPMDYNGHGVRRQFILSAYRGLSEKFDLAKKRGAKKPEEYNITKVTDSAAAKSKMLLFEEPELYLHPDAVRTVKDLIYTLAEKSEFQIIAATQAPVIVDLAKPHTSLVRVTTNTKSGSKVTQVASDAFEDDEKLRLQMLNQFDAYVCEAFFSDNVVLVEGETEKVVLTTLLERLKSEESDILAEFIHVVNCGGKMYIPLFQKVLRHFKIPYTVLHDLDSKLTKDGKKSAAWTMNERIWNEVSEARKTVSMASCSRYVFSSHFEKAHNYEPDDSDGKPFSAYLQAKKWDLKDTSKPAVAYMRYILGLEKPAKEQDQAYVEALAQ